MIPSLHTPRTPPPDDRVDGGEDFFTRLPRCKECHNVRFSARGEAEKRVRVHANWYVGVRTDLILHSMVRIAKYPCFRQDAGGRLSYWIPLSMAWAMAFAILRVILIFRQRCVRTQSRSWRPPKKFLIGRLREFAVERGADTRRGILTGLRTPHLLRLSTSAAYVARRGNWNA